MPWKTKILVVANASGSSPELSDALTARANRSPAAFVLIVPATGGDTAGREEAERQLREALDVHREAGLEIDGSVGDADPILAVDDVFDPREFDEVIVATFPPGVSQWLQIDLPHRVSRLTALPVTHVVARPRRVAPARPQDDSGARGDDHTRVLAPLRALAWGPKQHT